MYLKHYYSWPKVPTVFLFQALCTSLLPLQQSLPLHLDQLVLWLDGHFYTEQTICSLGYLLCSQPLLFAKYFPATVITKSSHFATHIKCTCLPSSLLTFHDYLFTFSVKRVAFRDVFNAHPLEIWQVGSYLDVCVWKQFLFVCSSPRPLCTFRPISSLHCRRSILSLI